MLANQRNRNKTPGVSLLARFVPAGTRCVECRRPIVSSADVGCVGEGGSVSGTVSGVRNRPPVYWCPDCWIARVDFEEQSSARSRAAQEAIFEEWRKQYPELGR
jgi:hypothetical protein